MHVWCGILKKCTSSSKQDSSRHFIFKTTNNDGSYHVHDIEAF